MKKKLKIWFSRHKQQIIIGLMVLVVVVLAIGTIVRGVHSLKDMSSEDPGVADDHISFAIAPVPPEAAGQEHSADKLYRDRESAAPAPQKDVEISFGAIFEEKGIVAAAPPIPELGMDSPAHASPREQESTRIKRELDAIYGRSAPESGTDKRVINNTDHGTEAERPLTEEELLAQQKKLMEEGFSRTEPDGTSASGPVTISSPSEIPAFIHGSQTVKDKTRLALRIDVPVVLSNGQTIPRNTIIYGAISIEQNRVQVLVESIKPYALFLTGFGEDGMPGLPVQIEQNQKIIGDATSSATSSALDRKISAATGGLVGSVVRDISNTTKTRKESYVTFFDNQKVFLRPSAKR